MRWLLLSLAACSYSPTAAGGASDGPIADAIDAPPAAACFGVFEKVCLPTLPTADFTLGGATNSLDTGIATNCAQTATGTTVTGCVIAATQITIDGVLNATGTRSLILVATTGGITVPNNNIIDVASHRSAILGAGGNPQGLCTGGTAPVGGAGGAGGSLVGRGGDGGTGSNVGAGTPNPELVPTELRGGCPGGLGGNAAGALAGGNGGGALLMIASSISIDGDLDASGAGGEGGVADVGIARGGAGGGSGGMIVFDTALLSITGHVMAQGGGGGEGNNSVTDGDHGDDPTQAGTAAKGGSGGTGNNGGDGAVSSVGQGGENGMATAQGGGGGGGTGMVLFVGATNSGGGSTIRPPPMSR